MPNGLSCILTRSDPMFTLSALTNRSGSAHLFLRNNTEISC